MQELKIFLALVWIIILWVFGVVSAVNPARALRFRGVFRKVSKEDDPRYRQADLIFMKIIGIFAIVMSIGIVYLLIIGKIH